MEFSWRESGVDTGVNLTVVGIDVRLSVANASVERTIPFSSSEKAIIKLPSSQLVGNVQTASVRSSFLRHLTVFVSEWFLA